MEDKEIIDCMINGTGADNVENEDNELLLAFSTNGRFVIGSVDEVNGPGAQEIPDFIPTRHELIQLAKHWAREVVGIRWFEFVTGSTGSTEIRLRPYARRRIARIACLLGEDQIEAAVDEVYDQFRKECDEKSWDIFMNGDEAQWEAVQEEFHEKLDSGSHEPIDRTPD